MKAKKEIIKAKNDMGLTGLPLQDFIKDIDLLYNNVYKSFADIAKPFKVDSDTAFDRVGKVMFNAVCGDVTIRKIELLDMVSIEDNDLGITEVVKESDSDNALIINSNFLQAVFNIDHLKYVISGEVA
jgi:hypothetical protein